MNNPNQAIVLTPLIKSGPGGDYVTGWPTTRYNDKIDNDPLGLFGRIGIAVAFIATSLRRLSHLRRPHPLVGRKVQTLDTAPTAMAVLTALTASDPANYRKLRRNTHEFQKSKTPKTDTYAYPQTTPDPAVHRRLSPQQWLFPDSSGDCPQTTRKQSHRFRTRRSPRSKRTAYTTAQQGTLFDD